MRSDDPVEEALAFTCERERLWGIISRPAADVAASNTAVLIVVGGPQYRVGSHRQFVLLARRLAREGYTVLRFDYRGMGDSEGALSTFEGTGADIAAAIDALCHVCPTEQRVVVWGLCDAATAALMFATSDPRVAGIVAANPWVRSEATLAAARVKHYYGARLAQREFWVKIRRGEFDWRGSARSLIANLNGSLAGRVAPTQESFRARMARGLTGFRGRMLLVLSGNDLTAQEFVDVSGSDPAWNGLLVEPRVRRVDLPDADHTFSRRDWLRTVEDHTVAWLAEGALAESRTGPGAT